MEVYLWIVTKATGKASLAKFRLNPIQELLLQLVALCWVECRAAQILVPKSRQLGTTTFVQAFHFARAVLEPRFRAMMVAHRESSSTEVFKMLDTFERNLPEHWQLPLRSRTKGEFGWEDGGPEADVGGSNIQIGTIGSGDSIGKGFTLTAFHGTEVANWSDKGQDAGEAWDSVSEAVAELPDGSAFLESTAKGRDPFFFPLCEKARKGEAPWEVALLPWYLDPTYQVSVEEYTLKMRRRRLGEEVDLDLTEEEKRLVGQVRAQEVLPGEEWIKHPRELTLEQLLWRRLKIMKLEGGVAAFRRYYPSTYDEAFETSALQVFPSEVVSRYAARAEEPQAWGVMAKSDRGKPRFVPRDPELAQDPETKWNVALWQAPERGGEYVIGADVGEGLEGGDPSAAYVVRKHPLVQKGEVVAALHGWIDPDEFTSQLELLGYWYNEARIAVEVNKVYTPAKILRRRKYPSLVWSGDESNPRSRTRKPGWRTTPQNRPVILQGLRALCRDDDLECPDVGFAAEMPEFVPSPTTGKWEARAGAHDDRIMALAIGCHLLGFRDEQGRRRQALREEDVRDGDAVLRAFKRDQEFMKRRKKKGRGFYSLS